MMRVSNAERKYPPLIFSRGQRPSGKYQWGIFFEVLLVPSHIWVLFLEWKVTEYPRGRRPSGYSVTFHERNKTCKI